MTTDSVSYVRSPGEVVRGSTGGAEPHRITPASDNQGYVRPSRRDLRDLAAFVAFTLAAPFGVCLFLARTAWAS
jgi:hypothetical protein